jgi:nicotinic acetylcholine receptor alpha-3
VEEGGERKKKRGELVPITAIISITVIIPPTVVITIIVTITIIITVTTTVIISVTIVIAVTITTTITRITVFNLARATTSAANLQPVVAITTTSSSRLVKTTGHVLSAVFTLGIIPHLLILDSGTFIDTVTISDVAGVAEDIVFA